MAFDMFLKLDGIEGESADSKHKAEIEIESFSLGLSNSGSGAPGGGGGAGRPSFQDLSFTTAVSKASPRLFLACASGEHIPRGLLTVRKPGGQQLEFYKVTLNDVLVSSYKQDASPAAEAGVPVDQVSLDFAKIQIEYRAQKPDGSLDAPVKAGWDVRANTKL